MHNYRVYTGPTLVQSVANMLRTSDVLLVTLEGTEHVYVSAPSQSDLLAILPLTGFNHMDVREVIA
jgi:hypothetical protein